MKGRVGEHYFLETIVELENSKSPNFYFYFLEILEKRTSTLSAVNSNGEEGPSVRTSCVSLVKTQNNLDQPYIL